jgi:TonB-dependent starch-binding outer membrane protein SusC
MKLNYYKLLLTLLVYAASITASFAQARLISGRVLDETGQALPGANIIIKNTTQGTTSDSEGKFSIAINGLDDVIVISFIGYETKEIAVGSQTVIETTLLLDAKSLGEVIVIGYGEVQKSDLTGAVGSVKGNELTQVATPDAVQAVQGRIAGVQVVSNSGEPGSGATIKIRGIGSINGSNPLYVVDGYQTGDISFLAPADIESIDVLKDASATAIYGSRGANGVVVVTTKKGKKGPVKFTFDSYIANQKAWRTVPMVNATEYANLVLQGYENDGTPLSTSSEMFTRLDFIRNNKYVGTNWQDEVMQSGFMQNQTLTLAGGNEQNRFRLSGSYFSQDGIVKNSSLKKYFVNFSDELTINNWLSAGISSAFTNFEKNYYNGDYYSGILTTALAADPTTPAWNRITNNWGRADLSYTNNPARSVDELKNNKGYGNYLVANIWAEAKLIKGLSFKTQFGTTYNVGHNKSYAPRFFIAVDEARDQSSLWERRSEFTNLMWSNYFNYQKSFNKHSINVLAGAEVQQSAFNSMEATAFDVPDNKDLMYLSSGQGIEYRVTSNQNETSLQSFFGRLNYSFNNRYFFTGTLRHDGSSKFLGANRYGYFPSFAGSWLLSEETFLENVKFLSVLKLRAGWGRVGNEQSAGAYDYSTSLAGNNLYVLNDKPVQGYAPTNLSNPELRWEVNQQTNVGFDFNLFDDRLTFTADYFDRRTNDMIVAVPIPTYVGAGAPRVNAGSMKNSGLEFTAAYRGGSEFSYTIGGNISFIRNELTSLGGGAPQDAGSVGKLGNTTRTEVGQPFPYFFGLTTDGIFNNQAELDSHTKGGTAIQPNARLGDVKFIDVNGDGIISDADRVNLGNAYPTLQYGFNIDLSYKGFDLRAFVQGVEGNKVVNAMHNTTRNGSNSGGGWANFERIRLDSWTAASPEKNEPRMTTTDPNNNIRFSDRYIQDGSYLRLKNIQIGYVLPTSVNGKLGITRARIYVAADNLFTITKYEGFDPEIGGLGGYSNGVDVGTYPQPRTFRAGFTLNF